MGGHERGVIIGLRGLREMTIGRSRDDGKMIFACELMGSELPGE